MRPHEKIGRSTAEIDHNNAIGAAEKHRARLLEDRVLQSVRREMAKPQTGAAKR